MKVENKYTVLVVDDEPHNIEILSLILSPLYNVVAATCAEQAQKLLSKGVHPELILLDVMMPIISGYQFCQQLKTQEKLQDIPIIFVTSKETISEQAKGFELGAVDYIVKPVHKKIVLGRVKAHIGLYVKNKKLADNIAHLKEKEKATEEIHNELAQLALTDTLTSLPNRRAFENLGQQAFLQYQREQQVFSIMLIDLDRFKYINDTYGHAGGDAVLVAFGELVKGLVRQHECIARYGGEEFIAYLPNTNCEQASIVAERMRKAVENLEIKYESQSIKVSTSIGISAILPSDTSLNNVVLRADLAVYRAKDNGRNQVAINE